MEYLSNIVDGRGQIADTIKLLLYNKAPSLFNLLNFDDDKPFTEPLLFAYFNSKEKFKPTLEQIIWGYIDEQNKPQASEVFSDKDGVIYLPNFGYLLTDRKLTLLSLQTSLNQSSERQIALYDTQSNVVRFTLQYCKLVSETSINFYIHPQSLFNSFFQLETGQMVEVTHLNLPAHYKRFEKALSIIKLANPDYYNFMIETVRGIYLYYGKPNSFATLSGHGVAFLNIQPNDGIVFFLDNIVHQCGHIIFNTISFEKEKWFTVTPNTPLSIFTKDPSDHHGVYGRFHGLFTQTNVNKTLDICIEKRIFTGDEHHELIGRFASNMKRFEAAIQKLDHLEMYTEIGKNWFLYFREFYSSLYEKRKDLIEAQKVYNQPYVFDYQIFKKSNPIVQ